MNTKTFFAVALTVAVAITAGTANADEKGEKLFKKKCATCHSMEPGKHKIGPSLAGVVGKKAGTTDFAKYKAFKGGTDIVWDDANLDAWITNQKDFLKSKGIKKGTAMSAKIKKEKDRKAIIGYLKGEEG
ncbi:MAG: c-type cytochrome [Rhodospirillaceae bacterium]|nr:c-type cytochrome [Rhodospirillaceae bacterium]